LILNFIFIVPRQLNAMRYFKLTRLLPSDQQPGSTRCRSGSIQKMQDCWADNAQH